MTTTAFYLIVTLWVNGFGQSMSPAMTATLIPEPYPSKEACEDAGQQSRSAFNGGAKMEWTCVPAPPKG